MSSFADRPPPDPQTFLTALDEWKAGDVTAGTALQTMKRGGLDEMLSQNAETDAEVLVAWNEWERGRVGPSETLDALEAAGVRDLLERVLQAQRDIFGEA
ncbi:MAG TPA: hypothetical protein VM573_08600 [Actinomycetota bacterium]|nr:hypothetical protein [Actinomycetota bacterium]HVM07579.1 hypothetical protein [Acidimicrobiales bacterium]